MPRLRRYDMCVEMRIVDCLDNIREQYELKPTHKTNLKDARGYIEKLEAERDMYKAMLERCGMDPATGESVVRGVTATQAETDEYEAMLKKHREAEGKPIEIPTNLEACFEAIRKMMPEEELDQFKGGSENDVIAKCHFGFGQWLRNNWGLWKGSKLKDWFVEKGLQHADDMSGVILTSFWRQLNDKPIDLDAQIKHYQDYWKKAENK
jgi:hypothetical protein